jgi:hypothetical protein
MTKRVTLLFVAILTLSSLTVVNVALAAVSKPPVPIFTVNYEDSLDYVPPVYSVNKYTGETTLVQQGYHVENKTITLTIKNQPFTQGTTEDKPVSLSYNIRVKGHFEEDWTIEGYIDSSDGEYTTKSYALGENSEIYMLRSAASGGQVDFQVQTLMGYFYDVYDYNTHSGLFYLYFPPEAYFAGEKSDWSSTQTIKIP